MDQRISSTCVSFQALPTKLHWEIFELLDYASALFFTATCHVIRERNPLQFQSAADENDFLFVAENYPQHLAARRYVCFYCNTIKPRMMFAKNQVQGDCNKNQIYARHRFCLDYGAKKGFYGSREKVGRAESGRCTASKVHDMSSVV